MHSNEVEGRLYEQETLNHQMRAGLLQANRDIAKLADHVSSLIGLMQDQARRLDAQAQQIETLQAQVKTLQLYHIAPGGNA